MRIYFLILSFFLTYPIFSQEYILEEITPSLGHLINFEANTFKFVEKSPTFNRFFKKLDRIYEGKKEKLHIIHIGGSHIQADIYSNKIRTYLHNMNSKSMGQRGFVFPYHLAHTNNPINYKISTNTKEKWQGYRCAITTDSIAWGLSGITAAFRAKTDTITVNANYRNDTNKNYNFDKLRVFYNTWKNDYTLNVLEANLVKSDTINYDKMYKEFRFKTPLETVALKLQLKDTTITNPEFAIMGMEFLNNNPGIQYTSLGVNGASFKTYNRGVYFERQLKLYTPDLFIISIGTNDAYVPESEFDAEAYKFYYKSFINMIQRINPECAILLTVPNDSYYKRKKPNPNTIKQQQIITEIAQEYNMAVWDFFNIMGGFGSSKKWYKNELMPKDRVHFTRLGYNIKADLMFTAFIEAWAQATNRNPKKLLNHFKNINE